jgi:hypothetical protein
VDLQAVFDVVLGVLLTLVGWFGHVLWSVMSELRRELSTLREEIPKDYVSKSDWKDSIKEIKELLVAISDKLDRKVDK